MLAEAFRIVQLTLLGIALPLALVAARGYADAPFGKVIRPLVPIVVVYIGAAGAEILFPDSLVLIGRIAGSIALVFIVWAVVQLVLLMTERRPV